MSDMIDGALGQQSHFERTFGFYVDGVSPTTARVAPDWREWLIPVCNANTNGATRWCLEPHDIAVAKYFAGREKDLRYTADLWEASYIDPELLWTRLRNTEMDPLRREQVKAVIRNHQRLRDTGNRPRPRQRRPRLHTATLNEEGRWLTRAALDAAFHRSRDQTGPEAAQAGVIAEGYRACKDVREQESRAVGNEVVRRQEARDGTPE